jgi:hypothetical protein
MPKKKKSKIMPNKICTETFNLQIKVEHYPGKGFGVLVKSRIADGAYEEEQIYGSLQEALTVAMMRYAVVLKVGAMIGEE